MCLLIAPRESWAMLQSRCKTFISQGHVTCSVWKDETVSEGNWRSPLSAINATGDAIPRDASLQLCFSALLSQHSLHIVSPLLFCLFFCTAVKYTVQLLPSYTILASLLQACTLLQVWANPYLQACVYLWLTNRCSEVILVPSGEELNDSEMLMQLIREAQSKEGRGFNIREGYVWVKRRLWVKIKSAQGEVKPNESITGSWVCPSISQDPGLTGLLEMNSWKGCSAYIHSFISSENSASFSLFLSQHPVSNLVSLLFFIR